MNSQLKSPTEYVKESISFYFKKENFVYFAKVMALLTLASTVLSLIMSYVYPADTFQSLNFRNPIYSIAFIFLSILIAVFGVYSRSTVFYSVVKMTDVKNTFLSGWKMTLRYFLATLTVGIIILGGIILLIVPGIIFAVWFSFTVYIVFDKNLKIKEALKVSKSLVKGKFWKVLGRLLVFGIFGILLSLIFGYLPYAGSIIISFFAPLYVLPTYFLYRDLAGNVG